MKTKCKKLEWFSACLDNIQKLYTAPAINEYYGEKQDKLLASYDGRPVTLSGDGHSDSPGHSASFCTYSFCDEKMRQILHTTTVLVQEADGKSPNMERIGFERSLDYLRERVTVEGVVTDAHSQIASMFKNSKKYEAVKHHWDIWHGCKNLVKKVNAIAQQRKCEDLRGWIPRIANHFWHSAMTCEHDPSKLAGNLNGVLHHIVNEHQWPFTTDGRIGQCNHGPLEAEREVPWLKAGSVPHEKLYEVLHDKRFVKSLPYYADFMHTGSLESLLMYASKRSFFTYLGYVARLKLAVLDNNFHSDRKQAKTKDGKLRYRRKWNKRTKKHTVVPVLEPKSYAYIEDLLTAVYVKRATTPGPMSQHVSMAEDDPRRVHPTIAMKPAESTETLVAQHKSRFSSD